ncbi:non-canonical purine NTP diphosphatase [Flavobacterium sp.]|jgi:XTP/dITP diphosphohydrolase|uniref:non-canonical purine NTP diphosphatase n=1 Tax=Flavobacterium sp. TaxID=239 RepID=UPI0037C068DD
MQFVFASNNPNKIKEIQLLLPKEITILSLKDIDCLEEIPETATTIEGNAILKANYVTKKYGYSCFADDTGLEVEALNGEPGVYSARYAGEQKNADDNMNKLLTNLADKENRKAQFKTVICLNLNGNQHVFEGIIKGEIINGKRGSEGFGYDPIFIPYGYDKTFAEMPIAEKSKISHRGLAVEKLVAFLTKEHS